MDFIELIKMVSIIFINHYYVKRLHYNNVSHSNPKCTKLVDVQITISTSYISFVGDVPKSDSTPD